MTTDEILKANQNQKYSYAHRAGIINAIGVTMFLAPVKLYDSGISGTSMLLGQLTPEWMSLFLAVLNIPIFLFGTKQEKNDKKCVCLFAPSIRIIFYSGFLIIFF